MGRDCLGQLYAAYMLPELTRLSLGPGGYAVHGLAHPAPGKAAVKRRVSLGMQFHQASGTARCGNLAVPLACNTLGATEQ